MARIFIKSHTAGSRGALSLARAIGAKVIKHVNSNYKPRASDIVGLIERVEICCCSSSTVSARSRSASRAWSSRWRARTATSPFEPAAS